MTRIIAGTGFARLMLLCFCQDLLLLSILLARPRTLMKTVVVVRILKSNLS